MEKDLPTFLRVERTQQSQILLNDGHDCLESGFDLTNRIRIDDLLNPRLIRATLTNFKQHKTTNSTTKIKYVRYFKLLVSFISTDFDSPEFIEIKDPIQKVAYHSDLNTIYHEIKTSLYQLSRRRGEDLAAAKIKARKRLVESDEVESLLEEIQMMLRESFKKELWSSYSQLEVIKIRDCLIAIACIRLARRSQELMTLSLQEF